ncbi:magnesium-transporting ATPase (P-type) [Anoxybacillus calidus]|uniref:Magnesium-transporting ATPase (P-type) n=1 Tax=[Anoxybacillus] calidus TaxID=575178 RepID=A0A7W0BW41_9BACL|nr:magnesium-transporting ATPase (P-type) [Anoxybacillus calidus]
MKLFSKQLIISFLVCLLMLHLTELFTIEPHVTSGNGNPGLLIMMLATFSFLFFGRGLWKVLTNMSVSKRGLLFMSIGSFCILSMSAFLEITYVLDLIKQLGGPPSNVNSRIYRFSWINQYTNTFYVNVYTYIIFISSIVFIYSIQRMFTKDKKLILLNRENKGQ